MEKDCFHVLTRKIFLNKRIILASSLIHNKCLGSTDETELEAAAAAGAGVTCIVRVPA